MFELLQVIAERRQNDFIDRLIIQVMTDSALEAEDRSKVVSGIQSMRPGAELEIFDREFDREGLERLRKIMGKKKATE